MIGITIRVAVYEHRVIAKHNCHQYLNPQFLEKAMNKLSQLKGKAMTFSRKVEGKILPPLLLWMLGVPGGICVILWIFFFRGK
jgi:hypothetical protein